MSPAPILLDDQAMSHFIRDGYVVMRLDFPARFHTSVYEKIEKIINDSGNPFNNLLPRVPELHESFDHPIVRGALSSVLGPDY